MALLLCVGSMLGQTAEKLMAKWKTVEGAQYKETTEDTRKAIEENKEPFDMNKEDYEGILKTLKKSEQILLTLDEDQLWELAADIQALKGYETLFVQNDNKELNDSTSILGQLFAPKYQLAVYGKVKGNTVSDLFLRWDIWGKVVLGHTDCKIPKDKMLQAIFNGDVVSFYEDNEDEGNQIDMQAVTEEVKNGNVLFVIHGKEYPDFRSTEEARNYMISNGIHWNKESWVVGKAIKEKYPDTDRKVVIEYSEKEKDAE
jgi:hypothetical protein